MADQRITELATQTGAAVDTADPLVIVDLSDTSMAPTGTDKKITAGQLALAVQSLLNLAVASDLVTLAPGTSARNVIEGTDDITELIVKAFTGQSVPMQVWQNENGDQVAAISADLWEFTPGLTGSAARVIKVQLPPGWRAGGDGHTLQVYDEDGTEIVRIGDASLGLFAATGQGQSVVDLMGDTGNDDRTFLRSGGSDHVAGFDDRLVHKVGGVAAFRTTFGGYTVTNRQILPGVADLNVGEHGSICDPTAATPTVTLFLKDAAGNLRTATVPLT